MLEGFVVKAVRPMTPAELARNCWDDVPDHMAPPVIEMEKDGRTVFVFPSQDQEGNGPGALFGADNEGDFHVLARRG